MGKVGNVKILWALICVWLAIEISCEDYLIPPFPKGVRKYILTHCSSLLSKYAITFGKKFDSENLKP